MLQGGANNLIFSNTVVINTAGTIDANGDKLTWSGVIGGAGALTVASSAAGGVLTLTNTNGYSGVTTINSGATLALAGTGSIASSSGVADNGAFDISRTNGGTPIMSLADGGTVALGGNTLTLSNACGTFSGVIGGSGGLAQTAGTETLSGANTYMGGTALSGGTLVIGNDSALGTGTLAMAAGTTLSFLSSNFTIANKIMMSGDPDFASPSGTTQPLSGVIAGTFAPGNGTPGTSSAVSGNLAFQSGAIYLVQVNPSTSTSANVTDTASSCRHGERQLCDRQLHFQGLHDPVRRQRQRHIRQPHHQQFAVKLYRLAHL